MAVLGLGKGQVFLSVFLLGFWCSLPAQDTDTSLKLWLQETQRARFFTVFAEAKTGENPFISFEQELVCTSQPMDSGMDSAPGKVSLRVIPDSKKSFNKIYRAVEVVLANQTGETQQFMSDERKLRIVRQALSATGQWLPIEHYVPSTCGNSYMPLDLESGHYWSFMLPRYGGSFTTRLRLALYGRDHIIYSNEYEGTINPNQFIPMN